MTNKSYLSYIKLFKDIKLIIDNYNINWVYSGSDFEKSLLKAIKQEFNNSKINGCFFHYVKALWKKVRKFLENTKLIVFALKLYPFILKKNKEKYINEVYEYATSVSNDYKSFIKYFKKYWANSNFINFDLISNGDIINRTNNYVESFHNKLNSTIELSHPRISTLREKLIKITFEYYISYIENIFKNDIDKKNKVNIYKDIWNFLEKFIIKDKKNININLLIQDTRETRKEFEDITNKILHELFNFKDKNEANNDKKVYDNDGEDDILYKDLDQD